MHFVGMLAYNIGIPIGYDIATTLVSIIPAVFASYIVVSSKTLSQTTLFLRSALMGIGIGSMHYVGMSAMRMNAIMAYDMPLFLLSVIVAILLSYVALYASDKQRKSKSKQHLIGIFIASTVMGLAISSMHYIGMSSMLVFEGPSMHGIYDAASSNELINVILLVLLASSVFLLLLLEVRARLLLTSRLAAVLSSVQEGFINFDSNGTVTFANSSAARLFSLQKKEMVNRDIQQLLVSDHTNSNAVLSNVSKLLDGELSVSEKLYGVKSDKSQFPVLCTFTLLSQSKNDFVCTLKDLTDLNRQEVFTQTVFDNLPLSIVVKRATDLTFSHVNQAAERTLGMNKLALIGISDFELFTEQEAARITASDTQVIESGVPALIEEEPVTIEGETRYITTRKVPIFEHPQSDKVSFLLWLSEDVTELRTAREELVKINQRMSMAADAAQLGFWEWNTKTNALIWDDWMHRIYDVPKNPEPTDYSVWASSVHADDYQNVLKELQQAVDSGSKFHTQFRVNLSNGETRYIKADGKIVGHRMFGVNMDVTDRVVAEKEAERLSRTDALTGLANRVALDEFSDKEIARSQRSGTSIYCIYIDLDKFKPINDRYGHKTGDDVLIEIAKRLKSTVREIDCVARIGGDEFIVMLTEITGAIDVTHMFSRINFELSAPINLGSLKVEVGASIGTSVYPKDGKDLDSLLVVADAKMYENKVTNHSSR